MFRFDIQKSNIIYYLVAIVTLIRLTHAVESNEIQNIECTFKYTKFLCDCQHTNNKIMLVPKLDNNANIIEVINCDHVIIADNTIATIHQLYEANFKNIKNLILEKDSLYYPKFSNGIGLKLSFENVNVSVIDSHAIKGDIREIVFKYSKIGKINPFAINTDQMNFASLQFIETEINSIEMQAFKRFNVDRLVFIDTSFSMDLPSKSFHDIRVHGSLNIKNCNFKILNSKAFSQIVASKVVIENNKFDQIFGECFDINIDGDAILRYNNFGLTDPGAFRALSLGKHYLATNTEQLEIQMIDNTIQQQGKPTGLSFDKNIYITMKNLSYLNHITCDIAFELKLNNFFTFNRNAIYFQKNEHSLDTFINFDTIITNECTENSYVAYIAAGVATILLILIITVIVIVFYCIKKKQKENFKIITPEPRTYRETQIVLQIENAGLLKTNL